MRTIKRFRPNGWLVEVVQYPDDHLFYVLEYDDEGYPMDPDEGYSSRSEAIAAATKVAEQLAEVPNWELQARYDEEHGTCNGYAPWQLSREF